MEGVRLSVRRALVRLGKGDMQVMPPKSRRGRSVELTGQAVEVLGECRDDALAVGRPVGAGSLLFCGPGGGPVDPDRLSDSFRWAAQRAGLKGFRFHDLRHTHATLLMGENVHPGIVSERLGHSSIGITVNLYSHVIPGMQTVAADSFTRGWEVRERPVSAPATGEESVGSAVAEGSGGA